MPEISLVVSDVSSFNRSAGENVDASQWIASTFNHAALVTALRSRADGKDLYISHTTYGKCETVSVTGANTTNCRISFNLITGILGSTSDSGYRIVFGDLGRSNPIYAAAGTTSACAVSASSAPAVALPPYGYDVTGTVADGTRTADYPDFLVTRRAALHENTATGLRLQWRQASGEWAYMVRAWVHAQAGGCTAVDLGLGTNYRYLPNSLSFEQVSKSNYNVSLQVETAYP